MISELSTNSKNVSIEAEIVDKSPVKEFSKFGKIGRLSVVTLKDDSGTIPLTLWDEQVDAFEEKDMVRVENGYVKEWKGNLQLQVGRKGKIEKIK